MTLKTIVAIVMQQHTCTARTCTYIILVDISSDNLFRTMKFDTGYANKIVRLHASINPV